MASSLTVRRAKIKLIIMKMIDIIKLIITHKIALNVLAHSLFIQHFYFDDFTYLLSFISHLAVVLLLATL